MLSLNKIPEPGCQQLKTTIDQWNCVSLMRRSSTLDFVIMSESDMMALLHVIGFLIFSRKDKESYDDCDTNSIAP